MQAERNPRVVIVLAHILCGVFFLAPGYVRPDSVAIYAYLRSAVFDGNFDFLNEWAITGLVRHGLTYFSELTPAGPLANHWWIGSSMLSAPTYLLARAIGGPPDGFSGIYGVVIAWTTVGFAALVAVIAYELLTRTEAGTEPRHAALAIVFTVIGTPFFWQAFRAPIGTHVAGALTVALIFAALFRDEGTSAGVAGLAAGLATGLAIATRLQHFMLIPAVIFAGVRQRRPLRWWLAALGGGAIPLAAQGVAWLAIYGTPFGPITRGASLAGTTWMPFRTIALYEALFSSWHGLFTWSPVALIAVAGWMAAARSLNRETRLIAAVCLLMFAGEWFANGTFDRYFWGGMSFGARRFADLALPFILGIAWAFGAVRRRVALIALAFALTAWNIALMAAAEARTISLARYTGWPELTTAVLSGETWRRAAATNLHAPSTSLLLAGQSVIAILIVSVVGAIALYALRQFRARTIAATTALALLLVLTCICAARTRSAAAVSIASLHIDVAGSQHFGPLLDEDGLLRDEVTWAIANGDETRAEGTIREIGEIERLLTPYRSRLDVPTRGGRPAPRNP